MRIIPVLDLLGGQVVHARRGERQNYQPVESVLCDSAEPRHVARAFRERLGLNEHYIADLDAIQSTARNGGEIAVAHQGIISALAKDENFCILLDAGAGETSHAQALLELGVSQVVIGAETLPRWEVLQELPTRLPPERLAFSLDMRGGKILSRCPEMAALEPLEALEQIQGAGWREVILLDLERVG
ncbi:MAG TPA: HisA/HisF-related TIM barrel protein, partial [Anaerolineales bacterium]|nr:HisA/HisF-related TIM barrel protein [Anaerolineales bacterium]